MKEARARARAEEVEAREGGSKVDFEQAEPKHRRRSWPFPRGLGGSQSRKKAARRESRGLGKVLPASLQSEVELVRLHGRLLRGHEAGALGEHAVPRGHGQLRRSQPAKKKPAS